LNKHRIAICDLLFIFVITALLMNKQDITSLQVLLNYLSLINSKNKQQ